MAEAEGDVVEIIEEAIDLNKYVDKVRDAGAGAIATFLGTTRDTFEEKRVLELRYEAYHAMALEQLRRICTAARARWSLHRIAIVHRIGVVGIGEESVLVAVSSVHRKESLNACEFLIDELKASVPIWKKEVYETGEAWKQNSEFLRNDKQPPSNRSTLCLINQKKKTTIIVRMICQSKQHNTNLREHRWGYLTKRFTVRRYLIISLYSNSISFTNPVRWIGRWYDLVLQRIFEHSFCFQTVKDLGLEPPQEVVSNSRCLHLYQPYSKTLMYQISSAHSETLN